MTLISQKKADFFAVLEHELRNPLATIMTTVELMGALGTEAKETPGLLSVVEKKVQAMATTLDDIFNDSATVENTDLSKKEPVSRHHTPPGHQGGGGAEQTRRILVVDDNETAADSLGQLLRLRGYEVQVVYSGESALQKVLTFTPEAAVLDIGMAHMDGYQLVGMLQQKKLQCSYIALTGYGQAHDKKRALEAGFDFHLTKPTGIKQLEVVLEKALSSIRQ